MAVEYKTKEQKEQDRSNIYNNAIKLLELLNVLIPMVGDRDVALPVGLCQEISNLAFELGADIAMNSDYLEFEKSLDEEFNPNDPDDIHEGYTPWGY